MLRPSTSEKWCLQKCFHTATRALAMAPWSWPCTLAMIRRSIPQIKRFPNWFDSFRMKEHGNRKKKREAEDQVRTAPPSRTQVQGCRPAHKSKAAVPHTSPRLPCTRRKFKMELSRDFVRNRAFVPPWGRGRFPSGPPPRRGRSGGQSPPVAFYLRNGPKVHSSNKTFSSLV